MERVEKGQKWIFQHNRGPENFIRVPRWDMKPLQDGTVYSFEYTEEGIRITRYEYIPD
jgi:hypothetical protein